jgi:hypothetical protein
MKTNNHIPMSEEEALALKEEYMNSSQKRRDEIFDLFKHKFDNYIFKISNTKDDMQSAYLRLSVLLDSEIIHKPFVVSILLNIKWAVFEEFRKYTRYWSKHIHKDYTEVIENKEIHRNEERELPELPVISKELMEYFEGKKIEEFKIKDIGNKLREELNILRTKNGLPPLKNSREMMALIYNKQRNKKAYTREWNEQNREKIKEYNRKNIKKRRKSGKYQDTLDKMNKK